MSPPQLAKPEELAEKAQGGGLVVGEVDEKLSPLLEERGATVVPPAAEGRARSLAELGFARLRASDTTDPALLRPVYLRPPAIGPQQVGS
jgi:tRNA A37 threonylcarbamoyladenosine modification protein TsaB